MVNSRSLLALLPLSVSAIAPRQQRRQDGPVPSDTITDCTYFVDAQEGDTCASIAANWGISNAQFLQYNPSVKPDCSGLVIGDSYCVEENYGKGPESTSSSSSTLTTTPTTTASSAPSPTQSGLASNCQRYYLVQSGDTCANIVNQYHEFTLQDFYSWNPAVGDQCQYLDVGYYVCVGVPGTPTTPVTTPAPKTTGVSPTQTGIASNCVKYYQAVSGDSCDAISRAFGTFSISDFETWNPAVGSDCADLYAGYYYCVAVPGTPTSRTSALATPAAASGPSPTQSGIASDCSKYYQAVSGDSCSSISDKFGTFSVGDFEKWNPAVGSDCGSLYAGYYYCIAVPGTPTSRTSTSTTPAKSAGPSPTQSGIASDCTKYYQAVSGDSCSAISDNFGTFSVADFEKWNPAVGSDCSSLYAGYYYCVAVPGTPTTRTTTSASPTPTTNGPQPQQPGTVSNCNKFYEVVSGDSCYSIEQGQSISSSQFFSWNTGIKSDCSNLFLNYYVCVGIK